MSKTEIRVNKNGVRELLRSDEAKAVCEEYASKVQQRAGEGYVMEERNYPRRSGYAIRPDTYKARRDNLENNTLLKVLYEQAVKV